MITVHFSENPDWQNLTSTARPNSKSVRFCFHGGDYEECRLLRYKNPVRTSQETHYVSATEPSRLMLCKI
jgi:hypothetical protein